MDQQWLDLQSEKLEEALAKQGIRVTIPLMLPEKFRVDKEMDVAGYIDHTLLRPEATSLEVRVLCQEAREFSFVSVCVNPSFVSFAAEELSGSSVRVCTVVGFPLGATTSLTKVFETRDAIANGAQEIDMVIPVGHLKEGLYSRVYRDIAYVVEAARRRTVKVILETSALTKEEIVRGSILARMAKADFIKTSTGFGSGGALVEDVALMRRVVGRDMGVKASGGIRDKKTALALIDAGATRLGTSAGVAIVQGQEGESDYR